jgi:GPH family glycoside/pentoside/hexuronide:cation symporter
LTANPPSSQPHLSLRQKLAYASGVFLDQAGLHSVNALAMPVYNVVLGMNPAYIGYALASFRLWDAMLDPLIGYITDGWKSRWGRRKPFMLVGAILCGIIFPLVWIASTSWSEGAMLAYFVVLNLMYFSALAVYGIPYQALGFELTPDYNERTSLYTIRGWVSYAGFMGMGWIFPLSQSGWFGSPIQGVHMVTAIVGCFFMLTALVPVIFLNERFVALPQSSTSAPAKLSLVATVTDALRNSAYRKLVIASCLMIIGPSVVSSLGLYLNIYYICGGDVKAGATLAGIIGTCVALVSLGMIPTLPALGRRFGKAPTMIGCMVLQLAGSALKWVCYNPAYPYWQLLPGVLLAIGNAGFWTLVPSMVADVCDLDEFQNGRRREGTFASVTQWINKVGYSAANALSGLVLVWIGFQASLGGAQSAATLLWMRILFVVIPAAAFFGCLLLIRNYPLNSVRLQEIRAELERRRLAT